MRLQSNVGHHPPTLLETQNFINLFYLRVLFSGSLITTLIYPIYLKIQKETLFCSAVFRYVIKVLTLNT